MGVDRFEKWIKSMCVVTFIGTLIYLLVSPLSWLAQNLASIISDKRDIDKTFCYNLMLI
jgi:hypothetical protein